MHKKMMLAVMGVSFFIIPLQASQVEAVLLDPNIAVDENVVKAYTIARTNDQRIDDQEQLVSNRLYRHKMVRLGVIATGLTAFGYWWMLRKAKTPEEVGLKSAEPSKETELSTQEQIDLANKNAQEVRDQWEEFKAANDIGFWSFKWLTSWAYFKRYANNIGRGFFVVSTYYSLWNLCKRKLGQYFHEEDIEWFVGEQTRCAKNAREVQQYALILDGQQQVPAYQKAYCKNATVSVCNNIVQQVEATAGFMRCKMKNFPEQEVILKQEVEEMVEFMRAATDEFASSVEHVLCGTADEKGNTYRMTTAGQAFNTNLSKVMMRFDRICQGAEESE